MQEDFHYYATYCAAYIAGYSHEESSRLCYSAQFVDVCSRTFLSRIKAPLSAATTQLQLELMNVTTDILGLQDITRIWASFHFLPRDLYADVQKSTRLYANKYRLICGPNGDLLVDTVKLAKDKGIQASGLAMHVLADTWAHRYFAGTPSLVINNTDPYFYELLDDGERKVTFRHNPGAADDIEAGIYINSLYQTNENSIMNLGHGRAGHLPDYSFIRYKYLPAWGDYNEVIKDNPAEYYFAFTQMVYAMRYLRGDFEDFEKERYDTESVSPYKERIMGILKKRQTDSSADWKAFAKELSGEEVEDFDMHKYDEEYMLASKDEKDKTYLGGFIRAALAQKSMVTNKIFRSGNRLAGFSAELGKTGFKGIKDFMLLLEEGNGGMIQNGKTKDGKGEGKDEQGKAC